MPEDVPLPEALNSIAAAVVAVGQFVRSAATPDTGGISLETVSLELSFVVTGVEVTDPSAYTLPPASFPKLLARERTSLERGASPEAVDALAAFLSDYDRLAAVYEDVASSRWDLRTRLLRISKPPDLNAVESDLVANASATAIAKFHAMRAKFEDTSRALETAAVAAASPAELRVRVDANGFDGVPEASRQRMQVQFRAGGRDLVQVEGRDISVPS